MDNFEELLLKRLDSMDQKLDEVRTISLPSIKTELALVAEREKTHNRIFSVSSSVVAAIIGALFHHVKR